MNISLQIEVRASLEAIAASDWNALNPDGNPFLRYEFLHTLSTTGCLGDSTGWYPRYFLLWQMHAERQELIGAVPAYIKTNSYGEFVFDWAWAEAYERNGLSYYPKLVCSVPFTPATGTRLLIRPDQPFQAHAEIMATAIRQFADSQNCSGVHYLFLTQRETDLLCRIKPTPSKEPVQTTEPADQPSECTEGSATDTDASADETSEEETILLDAQPANDHLLRIDCQYHWHNQHYQNFDDFLADCTAKRRKTIRRERRYVTDTGLRLERRSGDTLSAEEWSYVHQLYASTYDRKWGNPSLTLAFFEHIGQQLGKSVLIVLAYDDEDSEPLIPVACSIMFVGKNTLYGRYWGCRRQYHSLHFEACYYQGIDYCIAEGLQYFEPGAQGEHKITRGFVPTLTRSAHYISHPGFRDAIGHYLEQERPHVEQRRAGLNDLLPFKSDTLTL